MKKWLLGLLPLLVGALISIITYMPSSYIDNMKPLILFLVWASPCVSSVYIVRGAEKNKILLGLAYSPFYAIILLLVNFSIGFFYPVDFGGVEGSLLILKIYFISSLFFCGIGICLGFLFPKINKNDI